jgi:predicted DNA-binding transcriptional regulator YafY
MATKDYDKILTRLVLILSKLSADERPSTAELAEEFNVTIRTIQQDVYRRLLSFPIIKDSDGKLKFIDGYSLDRSSFDTDEMILLSLGLSQFDGVDKLSSIFNNVTKKIMHSKFLNPYFIKQDDIEDIDIDSYINNTLEDAIQKRYLVKIKCPSNDYHEVEPYKITSFDGIWYLFAKDTSIDKIKTYLFSNIKKVEVLPKIQNENIEKVLQQLEDINTAWFEDGHKIEVIVKIKSNIAQYFKKKEYFKNQKITQENSDGSIEASFSVSSYEEFDNIIKSWLPDIEVVEPIEYRDRLIKELREYINNLNS